MSNLNEVVLCGVVVGNIVLEKNMVNGKNPMYSFLLRIETNEKSNVVPVLVNANNKGKIEKALENDKNRMVHIKGVYRSYENKQYPKLVSQFVYAYEIYFPKEAKFVNKVFLSGTLFIKPFIPESAPRLTIFKLKVPLKPKTAVIANCIIRKDIYEFLQKCYNEEKEIRVIGYIQSRRYNPREGYTIMNEIVVGDLVVN